MITNNFVDCQIYRRLKTIFQNKYALVSFLSFSLLSTILSLKNLFTNV